MRFCVLVAFAVGPLLSDLLDRLSRRFFDRMISVGDLEVAIPGVRLTLWLAGLIILGAGLLAVMSLRAGEGEAGPPEPAARRTSPLDELLIQEGAELVSGVTRPFDTVRRSYVRPPPPTEDEEP